MKKITSLMLACVMLAILLDPCYAEAGISSTYTKHNESTILEDGKIYKVEEDLEETGDEIKTVSRFTSIKGELLETQIICVNRSTGIISFENRDSHQKLINLKSYTFDEIVRPVDLGETTYNVLTNYSNDRGKFLRHEDYTINLFKEKATALVVGSILAGVLAISTEAAIPLGAKLVQGATSAGLIGSSGIIPWNVRASVDVYSSHFNAGKHYTRYYGDFYTTNGEYITSLHWSKRGHH